MSYTPPIWRRADGSPVACVEKIKVLNENIEELRQMAQDALEDAVLLECTEAQIRQALHDMINSLHNPYQEAQP
jgi:regulator of replication initiation timing